MPLEPRYVGSRDLNGLRLVSWRGEAAIEQHGLLTRILTERCGDAAGALFAEPVLRRGNGATSARVDWYAAAAPPEDQILRWSELDGPRQNALGDRLRAILATIRPVLFDEAFGPLVAGALNLCSRDSLALLGDRPLIVDWGVLPATLQDQPARRRHSREILAGVAEIVPTLDQDEWAAVYAGDKALSAPSGPAISTPQGMLVRNGPRWRIPAVASGIAAACLLLISVPGVLAYPERAGFAADPAVRDGLIRGLRTRLDRLVTAVNLDCAALAVEAPRLLPTVPVAHAAAARNPGDTGSAGVPGTANSVAAGNASETVARIERSVVLVVAGDKLGSGFFVSPELIVTNRHVIDGAGEVMVASKHTGLLQASVVRSGGSDPLQDFALLKVPSQPDATSLSIANQISPMEPVISAGFPGLYMATDPGFQRLVAGDPSATADLAPVLQTGIINHLQRYAENGVTLVVHSAEIAPGNSGGPLLDQCSRVVGVNTFDRSAADRAAIRARYALGSDGLGAFLAGAGAVVAADDTECAPPAPAATAQAPSTQPAQSPPPAGAASHANGR